MSICGELSVVVRVFDGLVFVGLRARIMRVCEATLALRRYIVKPSETSQGTGIYLVQTPSDLPPTFHDKMKPCVVQE